MLYLIGVPIQEVLPPEAYPSHMALMGKSVLHLVKDREKDQILMCSTAFLSPHSRARNEICSLAQQNRVDRLLFVDADMVTPPLGLVQLAKTMDETGAQVVSGQFYQRAFPYSCTWSQIIDGKPRFAEPRPNSGLHEICASGLAFTLVDFKWVMEKIQPPYFQMIHTKNISLWEDGDFCNRIMAAGGRIVGDSSVQVGHLGFRQNVNCDVVKKLRLEEIEATGDNNGSRSQYQDGQQKAIVEQVLGEPAEEGIQAGQ